LKNNVSFKFNSSHQLSDILDKNCDCDRWELERKYSKIPERKYNSAVVTVYAIGLQIFPHHPWQTSWLQLPGPLTVTGLWD
jgi:hypothetical protein